MRCDICNDLTWYEVMNTSNGQVEPHFCPECTGSEGSLFDSNRRIDNLPTLTPAIIASMVGYSGDNDDC